MKQDTKQLLIEAGLDTMYTKGYHNTGIKEILDRVNVPKGSFYHYFDSKDDFGHQVLDYYSTSEFDKIQHLLQDASLSPLARLKKFYTDLIKQHEQGQFSGGCFLSNMSQEMGNLDSSFEDQCETEFGRWRQAFAACLREAQAQQEISDTLDVDTLAEFMLNSWNGALIRMKVARSIAPLTAFTRMLFDHLLA